MLHCPHYFSENLDVLCVIQSSSDDQNVPLSFHCLKITLFSMSPSHDPMIRMFHLFFIVLKISLFFMSSSHDSVIRMFHWRFIVLKISLFPMSFSSDPLIRIFYCLFRILGLKISLFFMSTSHDPVIRMFPLSFHRFAYLTVLHVIQSWSSVQNVLLTIVFSLSWKSRCFPSISSSPNPMLIFLTFFLFYHSDSCGIPPCSWPS